MGEAEMVQAPAAAAVTSRLEARHLRKSYGGRKVVHDVSVSVARGEVVGSWGPTAPARRPPST